MHRRHQRSRNAKKDHRRLRLSEIAPRRLSKDRHRTLVSVHSRTEIKLERRLRLFQTRRKRQRAKACKANDRHAGVMKHVLTGLLLVASIANASLVEYPCDNHGIGHLTPFFKGVTYEERYRKLLESRLGLTPFDCGREIVWPDLGPETCVAIFSRIQNRRRTYWVTLTVPGKSSFWQVTDGMNRKLLNEASKMLVLRSDAEISEIRADLICEA